MQNLVLTITKKYQFECLLKSVSARILKHSLSSKNIKKATKILQSDIEGKAWKVKIPRLGKSTVGHGSYNASLVPILYN